MNMNNVYDVIEILIIWNPCLVEVVNAHLFLSFLTSCLARDILETTLRSRQSKGNHSSPFIPPQAKQAGR